ncbi:MAG: hypothetical protein VW877_08225 [Pseudomonadaceae bacterium]
MLDNQPRSKLSWILIVAVGVWLGNLLHDATLVIGAKLWVQYELHSIANNIEDRVEDGKEQARELVEEGAEHAQEWVEGSREHLQEALPDALPEALPLPSLREQLCEFWRQQVERHPGERTERGVAENCD